MKFPAMNKRPRQAVVVPELSGGLNLRDSVSMINDNQLTDCKNVWFRDGVLKTRAGISETFLIEKEKAFGELKAHDIYSMKGGENCRLFSQYNSSSKVVNFYWIGKTWHEYLPDIFNCEGNYFVTQKNNILYCYCSEGVFKYDASVSNFWESLTEHQMYIPLIMIDCANEGSKLSGVMYEGYNLLSKRYRIKFNLDKMDGQPMLFTLPHEYDYHDLIVKIEYLKNGVIETVDHMIGEYNEDTKDGLILYQHPTNFKKAVAFTVKKDYSKNQAEYGLDFTEIAQIVGGEIYHRDALAIATEARGVVSVIVEATNCDEGVEENFKRSIKKAFKMSHCTWFGGDSAGINGGTRLFLGGNTEEPNLVIWSDLNNPLYFPENNYFYVGESSSAVTAFGKQSDMLVIFKEDETYFTQYNRNTGIDANDLIDQTVVDYIGSSVYFPLTLINANIGCDCPDSVQLCRNRLVWACSEGKVYTLVSNNQYSERNIFEISEMVQKRLKGQSDLKKAHSSDWNGYYLLQVGSNVYVLDYNSYGYQYVSSYSKTEDANIRIPWYYWEFVLSHGASAPSIITTIDNDLKIINSGNYGIFVGEISENCSFDNMLLSVDTTANYGGIEKPIECYISTKLFEFGAAGYRKNVDKVILSLGNNGGAPIKAEFITDEGTEEEYITLEGENTEPNSPGYIKSVPLNPCIRSVERFGVKLSCDGPLAVDGITLFFRVLGGVK